MIPALAPAMNDCTADDPATVEKALKGAATTVLVTVPDVTFAVDGVDPMDLTATAF